jgi:hypothetical protein
MESFDVLEGAPPSEAMDDPMTAWDHVEHQTNELFRDGDAFRRRVDTAWEDEPGALRRDDLNSSSDLEFPP